MSDPFRLNLEQQRKRAKALLAAARAGEAEALARFRRHHPAAPSEGPLPPRLLRLSEAQLVIARALGLPSWPRLSAHVALLDRLRADIAAGGAAPDAGMPTLHIRCGSDIAPSLRQAGFRGEFLEVSDPLCLGPVVAGEDWQERRIDFLSQAFGGALGLDRAAIAARQAAAEEGLARAGRFSRVVLWFEHDHYDQLILARCLAALAAAPPPRLEMVSAGAFPAITRFIGLGQLAPEALLLLWQQRQAVTPAAIAEGVAAWTALRAPDPRGLAALARRPTVLGRALRRHCQELPWREDGLGLTQRLVLQILAEAPRRWAEVYAVLMREREPLPWLSDLMFLSVVESLGALVTGEVAFPEQAALSPLGRAVLEGRAAFAGPARWVGGVAAGWCWDDAQGETVPVGTRQP
ncbi:DUF1835 domain-containing protein [Roseomonas sp. USHLN139]|uniref:DUF1835 domain-containing protein n=1 Tax=Roseomonas sp. USHLN139 TaxID=3081298 RepID=UPI003B02129D